MPQVFHHDFFLVYSEISSNCSRNYFNNPKSYSKTSFRSFSKNSPITSYWNFSSNICINDSTSSRRYPSRNLFRSSFGNLYKNLLKNFYNHSWKRNIEGFCHVFFILEFLQKLFLEEFLKINLEELRKTYGGISARFFERITGTCY